MPEREQQITESGGLGPKARAKMQDFAQQEKIGEGGLTSYFEGRIKSGTSVRQLAAEVVLSADTLTRFLRKQGIVILSQAEAVRQTWQDPEFRARHAEATRQELARRWQDPEFRARHAEATRQSWQDPEFRARQAEATRQDLARRWQDPKFRVRNAEAVRQARFDPTKQDRYPLPTIFGQRKDLPMFSQSAWEANLARIIISAGRDFLSQEVFRLEVPDNYQEQLPEPTDFALDFLTWDRRGNQVAYEIMAHPKENPKGWLKAELFQQQYPEVRLVLITERFYQRLRKCFEARINNNPDFIGWENSRDNLGLNPQKWAAE